MADAILDQILHNAEPIEPTGEFMRKGDQQSSAADNDKSRAAIQSAMPTDNRTPNTGLTGPAAPP